MGTEDFYPGATSVKGSMKGSAKDSGSQGGSLWTGRGGATNGADHDPMADFFRESMGDQQHKVTNVYRSAGQSFREQQNSKTVERQVFRPSSREGSRGGATTWADDDPMADFHSERKGDNQERQAYGNRSYGQTVTNVDRSAGHSRGEQQSSKTVERQVFRPSSTDSSRGGATTWADADPMADFYSESSGDHHQKAAHANGSSGQGSWRSPMQISKGESKGDHKQKGANARGSAGQAPAGRPAVTPVAKANPAWSANKNDTHGSHAVKIAKCLKGHVLQPYLAPKGSNMLGCDKCSKTFPAGTTMSSCRKCDYDLCQRCSGCPKVMQANAAPIQKGNVQMKISRESESLLRAALEASSGVSELVPSEKRRRADDKEEEAQGLQKNPRRQHAATVPPRAPGNWNLQSVRQALPAFEFRGRILDAIHQNQVIIVEGETGCGKTTQVGQFIIEDAAEKNIPCSVVCTQPRRISAISVSERVADERGERIGGTIGYSVRQESKAGRSTHLLFCTTGILLRRLENDTDLVGTTHIVVDEVHERGVESDFLLLALRDLTRRRRDIKVVMMSATMDKDLFGRYFGGAPGIVIPGRTFPVQDFFLEDALRITRHVLNPTADWAIGGGKGKGKGGMPASKDKDHADARKLEDLSQVQSHYQRYGPQVQAALRGMDQDAVNYDLLASLLQEGMLEDLATSVPSKHIGGARKRPIGVLVFLSGTKEIETAQLALLGMREFQNEPARSWVLPLHGGLPSDDQKKVFLHPPDGVRKIVLATNVAETSITIDDIGFVVDTCRMKEMRFDAVRRMSSLEDTVVSRTNARQRRGRAGRVAPGVAVHLGLTRFRHDQKVDDHQPPEVQRVPLEQLVLRIHATGLHNRDQSGKAASICSKLLEPPNPLYVTKSVEELVRLGAIEVSEHTGKEKLTALGKHLANLPLEARLGKLVLYGAAFGAVATDAALTVAAALTARNPFYAPLEEREAAAKAKRSFADKAVGGPIGLSDHLAVLAAYREWDQMPRAGDGRFEFCKANYLSIRGLQGMSEMKRSLLETLSEAGFVAGRWRAKDVANIGRRCDNDGVLPALTKSDSSGGEEWQKLEACPPALVAALLCAALFPQVATATASKAETAKSWKAKENAKSFGGAGGGKPKLLIKDAASGEPVKVKMHPGSVSANETTLSSPYILYQDLASTSQLYVRDVTPVPPLVLALFGGPLAADRQAGSAGTLIVDGWIKLALPLHLREPVLKMRQRLDALLDSWVAERGHDSAAAQHNLMNERGGAELLKAIVEILSSQEETAPLAAPPSKKQLQEEQSKQKKAQKKAEKAWGGGDKKKKGGGGKSLKKAKFGKSRR